MATDRSKSVFVGNIPYNLSEEQIIYILSTVGPVVKFRLMMNNETGKPKGFGFADFQDADTAAAAVRNLNDYEIGGRKIRVDWPHNNEKDQVPPDYSAQNGNEMASIPAPPATTIPPLPPGADLPPNLTCPDAISKTLSTLPPNQLLDVIQQMKGLAMTDPARATELLRQAPQLAYAIFQALLLMNLVSYEALGAVVEQASQPAPPPQAVPPPQAQPPRGQPQYGRNTPPVHGQPYPPPPPPPQAAQAPPMMSQEELLQQVLAMPQATIDSLPPAERSQIMALRQQLMGGGMR